MIFLLIYFRIVPTNSNQAIHHNKIIMQNELGCPSSIQSSYSDFQIKTHNFILCDAQSVEISNCKFSKIDVYRSTLPVYAYLILFKNADCNINNCDFNEVKHIERLISNEYISYLFGPKNTYTFTFCSNKIQNCYHRDLGTAESITVFSDYKTNHIEYNTIIYQDADLHKRSYDIKYYKNCRFIGNYIQNSYFSDSSAVLFHEKGEGENDLILQHCVFSHCQAYGKERLGSVFIISKLENNIEFKNTTFEYLSNDYSEVSHGKTYYKGYFIRLDCNFNDAHCNFIDCTFDHLETQAQSSGAIGLLFRNSNQHHLYFKNTKFMHLTFTNPDYGGGAISITKDVKETQNTDLKIESCIFDDIRSKYGNGGAIYFDSPLYSLIVDDTKFANIYADNENSKGGVIYAKYQSGENSVKITSCYFENTQSAEGGTIYIDRDQCTVYSEILIDNCLIEKGHASKSGNSIVISHSSYEKVTISNNQIINCGKNMKTYSIILDVSNLNFLNNQITFSDTSNKCGCVELLKIGTHTFQYNLFKNANYDNNMHKSAGIQYESTASYTSLVVENNIFDHINGNNQGRCIFLSIKTNSLSLKNNTFQSCPSGGCLVKIIIQDGTSYFTINQCKFISNEYNGASDDLIQSTPNVFIQNTINDCYTKIITVTFENCIFEKNNNLKNGGGLLYGNNKYTANTKVVLRRCEFKNNNAALNGGALSIQVYQGCKIIECKFYDNKSKSGCGAIYIETKPLLINYDNPNEYLPFPSQGEPIIKIDNCEFENDEGNKKHGIALERCINAQFIIYQSHFIICGLSDGYVISINSDVKSVKVTECEMKFTKGDTSPSGILSIVDNINLRDNLFEQFKDTIVRISCNQAQKNTINIIDNNFKGCSKGSVIDVDNTITTIPIIKKNTFEDITSNSPLICFIFNKDVNSIVFDNNTFSNFRTSNEYGGIGLNINNVDTEVTVKITFDDCYFINNTNSEGKKQGGAISCGHYQNSGNIQLTITRCFFEGNHKEDKGSSIYANIQHDITIEECIFKKNTCSMEGCVYIDTDYNDYTQQSSISIFDCNFEQNEINPVYVSSGSTKSLSIQKCTFDSDNGAILIDNLNNKIDINDNQFISILRESAIIIKQTSDSNLQNEIDINLCNFDSCKGIDNKCFDISTFSIHIDFTNSIIQNIVGTGCNSYFGTINCNDELLTFGIINISFVNNVCDSLYGGGSGIKFFGMDQLSFINCKFIGNSARQNKEAERPKQESKKPYYNGDGGGIQLGYSCSMNNYHVLFQRCIFKNNHAERHGGAISIQTTKIVEINSCRFENNEANYKFKSKSELLIENHFDKKSEGRGGAIYINPSYTYKGSSGECEPPTAFLSSVKIEKCEFNKNIGYDGYGIYVEGDDPIPSTQFQINGNTFTNNYNPNNHNENENIIFGAVITTEIFTIKEDQICANNNFVYDSNELKVRELLYVNHYGKTDSKVFTKSNQFTESNAFANSDVFTNSNKFSETNGFSKTNAFSDSIKFSNSNAFSYSSQFSDSSIHRTSNIFSPSSAFSASGIFSNTIGFTYSNKFSNTKSFSFSGKFTESNDFSNSNKFSNTKGFSLSGKFTESNDFSNSNQFLNTKSFSFSGKFTESNDFSNSNQFLNTKEFSFSGKFTKSKVFSNSNQFSSAKGFSLSGKFTRSNYFSNSNQFSNTKEFSFSGKFTESNDFSHSSYFSESGKFTKSALFPSTELFSKSSHFTSSDVFSESSSFTKYIETPSMDIIEATSSIIDDAALSVTETEKQDKESTEISTTISNKETPESEPTDKFILTETNTEVQESTNDKNTKVITETSLINTKLVSIETFPASNNEKDTHMISNQISTNDNEVSEDSKSNDIDDQITKSSKSIIVDNNPGSSTIKQSSKSINMSLIIGVVIGIIVLIAIIVIIIIFIIKKKKEHKTDGSRTIEMNDHDNEVTCDDSISAEFANPLYNNHDMNDPFEENINEED